MSRKLHTLEEIETRFRLTEEGKLQRIGKRNKNTIGTIKSDGFLRIIYRGVAYQASHLIFLLANKRWPVGMLLYKDGDRNNVQLSNLIENESGQKIIKEGKKIVDSEGNTYSSIADAARSVGKTPKSIKAVIEGRMKTCGGKKWKYMD